MFKPFGVLAIIPATVLLTLSFFVLFTMRKLEPSRLKALGKVAAVLLWVCAALVILTGICSDLTNCPLKGKRHHMMGKGMDHQMMQGQISPDMMAQ